MKAIATSLEPVLVIEPAVFGDERGWFYESWNRERFNGLIGRDVQFAQDNHSFSLRGILRGLHYQIRQPQGKLVRVIAGEVLDVAVDLRRSSPTFGQWTGHRLSAANRRMMWIPEGFAHGFIVLSESAEFLYKATDFYAPQHERTLLWNDPAIGIDWQYDGTPLLKPKDAAGARLADAETFPVIRALVTGCRGQVGSELLRALEGRAEVIARDRASLDLADADAIRRCVRDEAPQLIVNAGAYTAVDKAETDVAAARAVNATAPGVLAEEAKRSGALLVHFSTDYVFDGTKPAPYVETDPTNPIGAYGRTKLEGEEAIRASSCDHLILRTSWVYGAHGKNFLLTMLRLAATHPEIRVVDDQRGAPTSSRQIAEGVIDLLLGSARGRPAGEGDLRRLREASGLYHFTAAGTASWFEFAQAIFAERATQPGQAFTAPRVIAISTREYPTPARRPANSVLSNEKIGATFGVRLPDWRAGLRETLSALA